MPWLLSALLALLPLVPPAVASPTCAPRTSAPEVGIAATGAKRISARATELTFASKAMGGTVRAVVILPDGYAANSSRRYPLLFLLHGHGGRGHLDWINNRVETVIAGAPLIVVIPEGGYDGFYSDWYGTDIDGHNDGPVPSWETFHLRELLPWVDANYRTIADRAHRAIAGNSMGGFGSMSYAARHPDLFVAAAAFSGAVHPLVDWPIGPLAFAIGANAPDMRPPDNCIWGDPFTQFVRWADHDPTMLAANLGAVAIYHRVGDGTPGRHDTPENFNPGHTLNEFGLDQMNQAFDDALDDAGVAHTSVFEAGTHKWGYWLDGLREFLPMAQRAFAEPSPAPPAAPFSYTSGAQRFAVWGWAFRTSNADQTTLITVDRVTRTGLRVTGRGWIEITTPPSYAPGRPYAVNGAWLKADGEGRLRFIVVAAPDGKQISIVGKF